MKENYQNTNNPEQTDVDLEKVQDSQHKKDVKKRLDEILEQKRLRESIGMDETHSYWDEL